MVAPRTEPRAGHRLRAGARTGRGGARHHHDDRPGARRLAWHLAQLDGPGTRDRGHRGPRGCGLPRDVHRLDRRPAHLLARRHDGPGLDQRADPDLGDSHLRDSPHHRERGRGHRLPNGHLQYRRERPGHHGRHRRRLRRHAHPRADHHSPPAHPARRRRGRRARRIGTGIAEGLHRGARGHRHPDAQLRRRRLLALHAALDRAAGAWTEQRHRAHHGPVGPARSTLWRRLRPARELRPGGGGARRALRLVVPRALVARL